MESFPKRDRGSITFPGFSNNASMINLLSAALTQVKGGDLQHQHVCPRRRTDGCVGAASDRRKIEEIGSNLRNGGAQQSPANAFQ